MTQTRRRPGRPSKKRSFDDVEEAKNRQPLITAAGDRPTYVDKKRLTAEIDMEQVE